ncbi:Uncharacterised protein [Vibrio cholerae]|nr:Uncharacterised protein [Vibrio cholerae]
MATDSSIPMCAPARLPLLLISLLSMTRMVSPSNSNWLVTLPRLAMASVTIRSLSLGLIRLASKKLCGWT